MIKKDVVLNAEGAAPCKHCLKGKNKKVVYPEIVEDHGLFYARCPKCNHDDKYDFLGLSRSKAIRVWNRTMLRQGEFDVEKSDE